MGKKWREIENGTSEAGTDPQPHRARKFGSHCTQPILFIRHHVSTVWAKLGKVAPRYNERSLLHVPLSLPRGTSLF